MVGVYSYFKLIYTFINRHFCLLAPHTRWGTF